MTGPGERDFDFLAGEWFVRHRRLKERLAGCREWEEFDGRCAMRPLLGGQANADDNWLDLPAGAYRAATLRSYDPLTRRWSIWWLDGREPHSLGVPVVGGFEGGTGLFFADDHLRGRPVRVRFRWTRTGTASPHWEQAFSPDGGLTWEINWTMAFSRPQPR